MMEVFWNSLVSVFRADKSEKNFMSCLQSVDPLIEQKTQELRKDYYSDAKSNLDNINKYLTRNSEKDPQTKYLSSSKYFHNLLIGIFDQLDIGDFPGIGGGFDR